MVLNKTACFLQQTKLRDGSRTSVTSKMELFVIIVNGFQPLTITTKCSILDVAAVLDPLLKLGLTFKILTFNDLLLEWQISFTIDLTFQILFIKLGLHQGNTISS